MARVCLSVERESFMIRIVELTLIFYALSCVVRAAYMGWKYGDWVAESLRERFPRHSDATLALNAAMAIVAISARWPVSLFEWARR